MTHEGQKPARPVVEGAEPGAAGNEQMMEYYLNFLEGSEVFKSFKLSSRAFHFLSFIFDDILKKKFKFDDPRTDYFTNYVCLLMRTSGEFTFAHSLRTQGLALNLARIANIKDEQVPYSAI